jgi:hypothetical protein
MSADGWWLARIDDCAPSPEANARLIAAAPELLEALEAGVKAFDAIDKETPWSEREPAWWIAWSAWASEARAAIAKAKGTK